MVDNRQVVVIGSGPAGAMAARELVRLGIPVTLLEAGGSLQPGKLVRVAGRNLYRKVPPLEGGVEHTVAGDPRTEWYINLAPGGLSNQWTGAVPRFAPEDFTEGERLHECYRWPVTYSEMAPYYERVERLLDITADSREALNLPAGFAHYQHRIPSDWQEVGRRACAFGQDLTTMPLADGPPTLLATRGTAFNSYTRLVRPLLSSPHFQIVHNARALRLEWSGPSRRVEAVVYHDQLSGQQKRIEAAAVVVACGALHSTKLLFDSRCPDFPDGLGNADGQLGRYLHDHPREWWSFHTSRPISLLSPPAYLTRLPYETSPPLLATSWTLGTVGMLDKVLSRFGAKGTTVGVQLFGTMVPRETHSALPSPCLNDDFGLPRLDLDIRYDDDEVGNVVNARQHLLRLMEDAGYACVPDPIDPTLYPGTSVHYGGTVRMHAKRKYGVLDAWNRLRDVPNVLVCDASCFTTGAEKNPTLTVMALAARAAERLATTLKSGENHAT